MNKPFKLDDIEDVRIIIKAKGKHYSIVPKKDVPNKDTPLYMRVVMLMEILDWHDIVDTALEDINPDELKKKLNATN